MYAIPSVTLAAGKWVAPSPVVFVLLLAWLTIAPGATALTAQQLQWVTNPANGHRYATSAPMTWVQAEALAVSHGGHLATIRNQAEENWMNSTFGVVFGQPVWIGLSDALVEGTWVWVSGEPVVYTNWYPGEPNNLGNEDYCSQGWFPNGQWNDIAPTNWRGLLEVDPVVATFTATGSSCVGLGGNPTMVAVSRPIIGTTFTVDVNGLAPLAIPFMVMGFSNTTWAGGTLPYPIPRLGPPTCSLGVSPDAAVLVPTVSNTATWNLALPNNTGLLGLRFFNQCIVVVPPTGISSSNVGDVVVGNM